VLSSSPLQFQSGGVYGVDDCWLSRPPSSSRTREDAMTRGGSCDMIDIGATGCTNPFHEVAYDMAIAMRMRGGDMI
jgi:hypothetical protein